MSRTIVIDPVSRVEGRARITIHLDDSGSVGDAQLDVTELRGFEAFCEGRLFEEMPALTARICGICPVSHMVASACAGDAILGVLIPEGAVRLRRLVTLAQIVQSHALSFFHLTSPDLLLGFDASPEQRSIAGLALAHPDVARDGIRLRQFGQTVIETLGGRRVHPSWAVPGGVLAPLTEAGRRRILEGLSEALQIARRTLGWFSRTLDRRRDEADTFGHFASLFLGMVTPDGRLEHYGGRLRMVDADGSIVEDQRDPATYTAIIDERVEPSSYLKSPYYRPRGYPGGMYRVGPLARLNVASSCGTPLADHELSAFKQMAGGAVLSSFHAHYARLIEALYCIERMAQLLDHPDILTADVRAHASPNRDEGVGATEAPRGTLFHHYHVDEHGVLTRVNLLVATGQNNLAMNRAVQQIASRYIHDGHFTEGILNRVEAGIRAFDPCFSCSTHAVGRMPLQITLVDAHGTVLDEIRSDA